MGMNGIGHGVFCILKWPRGVPPPPPPLNAPSDLSASVSVYPWMGMAQVDLSWTSHSTDEISFRIECQATGDYYEAGSVSAGQTTYTTFVSLHQHYKYRVRAERNGFYSDYSNVNQVNV